MRAIQSLFLLFPFGLLAASFSREQAQPHSFEIVYEDGIPVATNKGDPKFSEELFAYEKALILKQVPDQPESLLNRPASFTLDDEGFFYVDDRFNARIAVYDPMGNYIRSFGREGDGPGEFSKRWWELRDLRGDVLDIYDSMHQRITFYRTDGTLLDVFTFPQKTSATSGPGRLDASTLIWLSSIPPTMRSCA